MSTPDAIGHGFDNDGATEAADVAVACEVLVRLAIYMAEARTPGELAVRASVIAYICKQGVRTQREAARLAGCPLSSWNRELRRLPGILAQVASSVEHRRQG